MGAPRLAGAEAGPADAQAGLNRREQVNPRTPGLVKEEDLETFRTRVRVAEAGVAQARSALDLAQLNQRDAVLREALPRFPNATVTEGAMGDGFYEAVISTLAERR